MNAIEFVHNYDKYINEIRSVIKTNLTPLLEKLADTDPHDLITPETWFPSESPSKGFCLESFH